MPGHLQICISHDTLCLPHVQYKGNEFLPLLHTCAYFSHIATDTYVQLKLTCTCTLHARPHKLICTLMLTPVIHVHTHKYTCRFVSLTESRFFEAIMKADRSLKCIASMTSVCGSMVTPMSGSILLTSSTTFLSLPLWMDR